MYTKKYTFLLIGLLVFLFSSYVQAEEWTKSTVEKAVAKGKDLSNQDLREVDFTSWHGFGSAQLRSGKLSGVNLSGVNLSDADLYGANLTGANLYGADLRWANLRNAILISADLRVADLTGADLLGADLTGADLLAADLQGAKYSSATKFPKGFDPVAEGMILFPSLREGNSDKAVLRE